MAHSSLNDIMYKMLKDLAGEKYPEHLIFFDDYWREILSEIRAKNPEELKGATHYLGPSRPGDVFDKLRLYYFTTTEFLHYGLNHNEKVDFELYERFFFKKMKESDPELSNEDVKAVTDAASKILKVYFQNEDIDELRRKIAADKKLLKDIDSGEIKDNFLRLKITKAGEHNIIFSGKTHNIEERNFIRFVLLAAARKYRGDGWVDKKAELKIYDRDQDLLKLRQQVKYILDSSLSGTELIKAGDRGFIRLEIEPGRIDIKDSICRYEHPDRRLNEIRCRNVFSEWEAIEARYKGAGKNPPPEEIIPVLTKYHINNEKTFYYDLRQILDYVTIVQFAVENIMGEKFHDDSWKDEWQKLKFKMEKLLEVLLALIEKQKDN